MAGHVGTKCIVCGEKFTSEDDVVICPECGTPYHRECYRKSGSCINTELHKSGGTWKPFYENGTGGENSPSVCAACGYSNPPLTLFCRRCGMPVPGINNGTHETGQRYNGADINDDPYNYNRNANDGIFLNPYLVNYSDPLCGLDPNEDFDGAKLSEIGDFVGTNTHYYVPLFKQFKETGRKFSLNFPAMIFPEFYFAYRKMPLYALAAFFMRIISMIPRMIYFLSGTSAYGALSVFASQFNVSGSAFRGVLFISMGIYYVLMFTFGFFGNRFYYDHSIRKIKRIKELYPGADIRPVLSAKGGTSALWLTLFICLSALPYFVLYFSQAAAMLTSA